MAAILQRTVCRDATIRFFVGISGENLSDFCCDPIFAAAPVMSGAVPRASAKKGELLAKSDSQVLRRDSDKEPARKLRIRPVANRRPATTAERRKALDVAAAAAPAVK